jgi:hypothetical protein
MRLTFPFALVLLLPACGDNGGGETSNTPTSNPSSTDPGTGSATGTTAPTTGTASSTGEPVTTTGESATGSGTSSSTDPATGSTTIPVDPSSTGESATGSTTDASSSGGSSEDTGATPGGACMTDKDCALHNDCCDCFGIKAGDPDPICKKGCDKPTCDVLGIDQAVCRFGVCGTERINCDSSKILCDALPPQCPPNQVAGVTENGSCWTGQCVAALSCNFVPDCSACPDDSMCVQKVAKPMSLPTCEPIPLECDGQVDCKCAGTFVCTGNFNICNALGDNQLSCGCPQC